MIKRIIFSIVSIFAFSVCSLLPAPSAHASTNNLIDDDIFNRTTTLSAADIDFWLNNYFGSASCISTARSFTTPDPQGWGGTQYNYGSNVSAGQALHDAATLYNINPEVILATMQKEQSIVTGSAGCYNEPDPATAVNSPCGSAKTPCTLACTHAGGCMNIAMSYGCPNYCAANDEGFSPQLTLGTWLLRFSQERAYGILTGYQGYESGDEGFCYGGPMTAGYRQRSSSSTNCNGAPGNQSIYYDGTWTDNNGQSTNISNGATASLYTYTPFINDTKFSTIFTGWFGNPYDTFSADPVYQAVYYSAYPGDSSKVRLLSNYSPVLAPGQNAWVVIGMKNTGNTTWTRSGGAGTSDIRLYPQQRPDYFCAGIWPNLTGTPCARTAIPDEASVAPGGVGTFEFGINAPTGTGTYNEKFGLVVDGLAVATGSPANLLINVQSPSYSAQPVWQGVFTDQTKTTYKGWGSPGSPVNLTHNTSTSYTQSGWAVVLMKNTSNFTWTKGGFYDVRLATYPWASVSSFCAGAWPLAHATVPSCTRAATFNESSVDPGTNATFEFPLYAPTGTGVFNQGFGLVSDGKSIFPNSTMNFQLTVQ